MHDDDNFTRGPRGQFRGDFTRDTFDPMRNFSRVLMQQGRVQLDADWNEQVSILLHSMRHLGRDLMGPHGAPYPDDAPTGTLRQQLDNIKNRLEHFKIIPSASTDNKADFSISPGRYYVNGICCETEKGKEVTFRNQPGCPFTEDDKELSGEYLVYLDVWERHLSYVEDDYIQEEALGGADTATRAQIVWQVKVISNETITATSTYKAFDDFLNLKKIKKIGTGQLRAKAQEPTEDEACALTPKASYQGAENQLYRVEIHKDSGHEDGPTFKWSRENGSVIFPITEVNGEKITLEHLGRDDRFALKKGDWVEVLDDDVILGNKANPLLQVEHVDQADLQVTLKIQPESDIEKDLTKHPYLRRWDQSKGADENGITVTEVSKDGDWILLENGVNIQFLKQNTERSASKAGQHCKTNGDSQPTQSHLYQTGDYWLIPARTATGEMGGDVEWPGTVEDPKALPPQGVEHHYAPLAKITVENDVVCTKNILDLRRHLNKGWGSG